MQRSAGHNRRGSQEWTTMMFADVLGFAGGVVLLALGGDSLLRGLVGLGRAAGAGALAAGLAAVAFGGSLPDLAVNLDAVAEGHASLALGNIIGSCLVNLGLVLGAAAALRALDVGLPVLRLLVVGQLGIALALLAMAHNGRIGYLDGAVLVAGFVALAVLTVRHRPTRAANALAAQFVEHGETRPGVALQWLRVAIGVVALWYGAGFVVGHAVELARAAGVSELFAGLTVVAIGTSLPQVVIGVLAARRGHGDVVVLSVVGSNIANLALMMGLTALIHPYPVAISLAELELPALIAFTAMLYPLLRGDMRVTRGEGAALLAGFVALVGFQLFLLGR
jgi:cation:H+ antiporter